MTQLVASSVETDTWVRIGSDIEITYEVSPEQDDIVFAFDGLSLNMRQAGLRRCIATFTEALNAFDAKCAAQLKVTSPDQVSSEEYAD